MADDLQMEMKLSAETVNDLIAKHVGGIIGPNVRTVEVTPTVGRNANKGEGYVVKDYKIVVGIAPPTTE